VMEIVKKKHLRLPMMEMVYKIVYEGLNPKEEFKKLMKLKLSSEDGL